MDEMDERDRKIQKVRETKKAQGFQDLVVTIKKSCQRPKRRMDLTKI